MAFTSRTKIHKPKGSKPPTPYEETIGQHLYELQTHSSSNELKTDLKKLKIVAAKEVEYAPGKKAVVIFVPVKHIRDWHRIQNTLVGELEKKLSGKHVLLITQRKIMPKPRRGNQGKKVYRPRTRTLTKVHDAILDDLVYPGEVVDRRTRVKLDGTKQIKVVLDAKEEQALEHKLDTFSGVYKKLTGKVVTFSFPPRSAQSDTAVNK